MAMFSGYNLQSTLSNLAVHDVCYPWIPGVIERHTIVLTNCFPIERSLLGSTFHHYVRLTRAYVEQH